MRRVLEAADHIVADASDGEQAMELHRWYPADVVITDILMPHKDGLELIEELRRSHAPIAVIAYTGRVNQQDELLAAARTLGANLTLTRPFSNEALLDAIRKVLAH
jgi:DNA-binding NarL/FixJ family response regulator